MRQGSLPIRTVQADGNRLSKARKKRGNSLIINSPQTYLNNVYITWNLAIVLTVKVGFNREKMRGVCFNKQKFWLSIMNTFSYNGINFCN